MIRKEKLSPHPTIPVFNFTDAEDIFSLDSIGRTVKKQMDTHGVSVLVSKDEIKSGKIFNSVKESCIIISNDEYYDYCKYCITIQKQSGMTSVSIYIFTKMFQEPLYLKEMLR